MHVSAILEKLSFYRQYQGVTIYAPLLSIVLIALLVPFIIIPQVQAILQVREEIDVGRKRFIRLEEKRTKLQLGDTTKLRHDLSLTTLALPSTKDIGAALVTLDILAQKNGITVGNFSSSIGAIDEVNETKGSGTVLVGAPSIKLSVAVIGEEAKIKNFLTSLTLALPLMRVEEIVLSKREATITLSVYYKPIIANLPPVDSELPSFEKLAPTLSTLASRSAQLGLSIDTTNFDSENIQQKFQRSNPFF